MQTLIWYEDLTNASLPLSRIFSTSSAKQIKANQNRHFILVVCLEHIQSHLGIGKFLILMASIL